MAGRPVDIIYLDFQKAFDKVPHKRLLERLKEIGIKGNLLSWIEKW
jgi:ribonucleases P/MRP protein subunit RPP40